MGNSCVCEDKGKAVLTDTSSGLYTKRETPPTAHQSGSSNEAKEETPVGTIVLLKPSIASTLVAVQQAASISVITVNATSDVQDSKQEATVKESNINIVVDTVDRSAPTEVVDFNFNKSNAKEASPVLAIEQSDKQEFVEDFEDREEIDMPVEMKESTTSSSHIAMSQLQLTKPAPEFSGTAVVDHDFQTISLSQYRGKYVVLFFYPLDFTFVCPTELIAFSDAAEDFRSLNCELIACSTDSHFSHLAWTNMPRKQGGIGDMKIPILADKNAAISKAYGVYKEDEGIAFRGLFIIDGKGNLRQITINDLPVGRSVEETKRLVQAFQFTDKHGEVCPANWKPGGETMKPNVKESKDYFKKSG